MAEKLSTKEVSSSNSVCILQGHSFIIYIFLACLVNEWLHHGWLELLLRRKIKTLNIFLILVKQLQTSVMGERIFQILTLNGVIM